MNILIDIGHPAHVHLFKHFAWEMQKKGHSVFFTCREKEFEIELLQCYGFSYKSFGHKYKSRIGKLWGLLEFDLQEFIVGLKFKPDLFLSHGSMYAAHAAFLLRKPHISLEDTFNFEQIKLYKPFTRVILSGNYNHPHLGLKCIDYAGYHELAYLHPNKFQINTHIKSMLGLTEDDKYAIVRFVSWNATHDAGHKGMSLPNKRHAIRELSKYAKVFISSESDLPDDLLKYKFPLPPEDMHHAIAEASLIFGESATMVSEGVVLGVPGVYLDNTGRYYTQEQEEKYGLIFNFSESETDQILAIQKAIEILNNHNNDKWQQRVSKMLADKIDVTAFLAWFIENYPSSVQTMRENPDYQYRFK